MKPTLFALLVLLSLPAAAEILRVDYTGAKKVSYYVYTILC